MAQVKNTAFLNAAPDRHPSLALGAVAIVDDGPADHGLLKTVLAERIQSIPRCTQLLRTHASSPEWIDYPKFDLADHLRRVAIPRPGDDAELSAAIAFALERPLDLDRPLWECWVIEGLKGNRWAILMKVHHRLADVASPAHLLALLCDDADTDAFVNHGEARQVSPPPEQKRNWADALWRASSDVTEALTNTLGGAIRPALRTSPGNPVTMRRYRAVRVRIADVDRICRKFGVNADAVALAAITEGFRTLLLHRGQQPRADSLPTLAPEPVRAAILPYLPVDHDDPVRRLRTVHNRWKAGHTDQPAGGIMEAALNCLPTVVRDNVSQLLARVPQRGVVTLSTHSPGPRHQLRLLGRTLESLLPIPPIDAQLSTGVAVLSYGDELVFGITAEYHAMSDVKLLVAGIELGVAQLVALSDDSVLVFRDRRRKRPSAVFAASAQRARPPAPGRARH